MKMLAHTKNRHQGFTMIEVMIAMLISLVLLLGLTQIFTGSRVTYRLQQGMSRLQESGRFAINFLRDDFRQAGYLGCSDDTPMTSILNNAATLDLSRGVQGFQAMGADSWSDSGDLPAGIDPADGTDAVLVRYVEHTGMFITQGQNPNNANLRVTPVNPAPIEEGDILTVTDCSYTTIFQVTNFNQSGNDGTVVHNTGGSVFPGNSTQVMPHAYGEGSELLKLNSIIYYVDENDAGTRSLFRRAQGGNALELVRGVENMQLQYGIDTNTDGSVDNYITADAVADWGAVMSIRASLLVNSVEPALAPNEKDTQTYTLLGQTVDPADTQQLRHVFTTTTTLRNRVLINGELDY